MSGIVNTNRLHIGTTGGGLGLWANYSEGIAAKLERKETNVDRR
jgi:hypothetical protein